jgi:replicative DNA helicase
MIIIDYLQLMSAGSDKGNREQEISTISRSLKALAKELSVPIITLSQLNRSVETRGGSKRPQLSDLRESGAIEQDADMVCFLYRPEYYNIDQDESGNEYQPGHTELIVAKHRNGALEDIPIKFLNNFAKFTNMPTNFGSEGEYADIDPMSPNANFNNVTTVQSKLNDFDDSDNPDYPSIETDKDNNVPF